MPNEIDIKGLREHLDAPHRVGSSGENELMISRRDLRALLDEIERLRGTLAQAEEHAYADEDASMRQSLRVQAAEAERDALKAKLECLERSYDSRSKQADELNARVNELKAKMERVREWAGSGPFSLEGMPLYGTGLTAAAKHVLNILDGKEG